MAASSTGTDMLRSVLYFRVFCLPFEIWSLFHRGGYINFDELVKSQKAPVIVIPVKTGIQGNQSRCGSDGLGDFLRDHQF